SRERRAKLQSNRGATVLENPVSRRTADYLRRDPPGIDLRPDQHCRHRISHQFWRSRAAHQRSCRTLRPRRHLRGDLLRGPRQRAVLHGSGKGGEMAETGRLRQAAVPAPLISQVTLLRIAIILGVLAVWEFLAHSGWLYRDVVPSLLSIG